MFFQLLFIHLFRPFLKYNEQTSPLPQNVSPRRLCTQAAAMISKLMRLYKRSHGLRQICNVCVYIIHSACTIHLLNLPDKNARRDIVHGVKHLEEIAEGWLGARRTLAILALTARKWDIELPEEAATVLARTETKFGPYSSETPSPVLKQNRRVSTLMLEQARANISQQQQQQRQAWLQQSMQQSIQPQQAVSQPQAAAPPPYLGPPHYVPQPSSGFTLPPHSATELRPQNYPSAHSTPGRQQPPPSEGIATAGASPSDMFGGVEQLLRDGQDWVFQDQAQLANGFENWGGFDLSAAGLGQSPINPGSTPTGQTSSAYPTTNTTPNGFVTNVSGSSVGNRMAANGTAATTSAGFINAMNPAVFDSMTTYDEQEWYQ